MPKRRHLLLCVVVLLSGCGVTTAHEQHPQAGATTVVGQLCMSIADSWVSLDTVAQLKQKARVIVVGTVVSMQAGLDTPCDIHTDSLVHVDRTVYDPQHQVTGTMLVVRTRGGQLPNGSGEGVEDEAQFITGEQLVLFLIPDTDARYSVVDGDQGATRIIGGVAHPMSSGPLPLDAYITQIERAK
jgi:hypothetical protein